MIDKEPLEISLFKEDSYKYTNNSQSKINSNDDIFKDEFVLDVDIS